MLAAPVVWFTDSESGPRTAVLQLPGPTSVKLIVSPACRLEKPLSWPLSLMLTVWPTLMPAAGLLAVVLTLGLAGPTCTFSFGSPQPTAEVTAELLVSPLKVAVQ